MIVKDTFIMIVFFTRFIIDIKSKSMGMSTTLYGCILEFGPYNEFHDRIKEHNDSVLRSLPEFDEWPPLTRQMFAVTQNSDFKVIPPNYEYYGRAFHFGGQFKSIECEWKEWKAKFEMLLTKLIWMEAFVHFKPEYADLQTFRWSLNLDNWDLDNEPRFEIRPEYWDFEGDLSWENM